MNKIVVIGASTGGPKALEHIVCNLPKTLGVPVLIIQHMPAYFTPSFAERLNLCGQLKVTEAKDNELISPGHIYVVPGEHHFFFEEPGPRVHLLDEKIGLSPSVDAGMISAVDHYGPGVIGVILSGMGSDGLIGARAIKQLGGTVIAESKQTATIYGMPKEIVENNLADDILPIEYIAKRIVEFAAKKD